MNNKRLEKFLCLILRHKPETVGITLDSSGWVNVIDLINAIKKNPEYKDFDLATLHSISNNSEKQRFEFRTLGTWNRQIRARQGHSVEVDLQYEPSIPPDVLYHGTTFNAIQGIMKDGLNKGKRHHVHLSVDKGTATNVGSRRGTPVIFVINAKRMANDGHKFYVTGNKVWLTDFVPSKYIIKYE